MTTEKDIYLVAGLGNPGKKYERTRHNTGFMVVDELSDTYSINISKNKFDLEFGRGKISNIDVILAKPMNFMNRSGGPIKKMADYFGIKVNHIIIVHDDLDLESGRLKIKEKGGHGGHNGIRSIINAFGDSSFIRLRIGIGRPGEKKGITGFVLGKYSENESENLQHIINKAKEAVVSVICDGIISGMNVFNRN